MLSFYYTKLYAETTPLHTRRKIITFFHTNPPPTFTQLFFLREFFGKLHSSPYSIRLLWTLNLNTY